VPLAVRHDASVSDAPTGLRAWKTTVRRSPGGGSLVRVIVFVAGLLFILLGFLLVALPGPLTIPPILVGLYIWSTEFAWAERLLDRAKQSAEEAWENAKRKPVLTGLITVSGLIAFGIGLWLVARYDLVERAKSLVGLG
jgi:hypothetical protein